MSVCNNTFSDTVFSMDHSSVKLSLSPATENILCAVNPPWMGAKSAKASKKFDQSVESMDTKSVVSSQLSMKSAVSRMDDTFVSVEMRSVSAVSEYLTARTSSTRGPRVSDRFRQSTDEAFSKDIYAYLRKRETTVRPRPDYMTRQHNVTRDMRAVLIDWFCDVIAEYNQSRATFFLAVNLVDRTLSAVNCPSDKLQLLGATAIFVAGKFEEVSPANIRDMAFVTEDTYDVKHIEWMERNLLNYVSFDLSVPTVEWFASYFSHLLGVSSKTKNLMWYLLELSALEYDLVATRPSVLAASALALAIGTTSLAEGWPDSMRELSGITIEEITPMIATLRELHERAAESRLNAIPIKYSDEQYHKVAQLHIPQNVVLRRD
ncbi:cyclin-A2-like protein [Aphelenchoides avenae]|nr:cyclin-A2-like protein [Aphelenchus avenae]